MGTGGLNKKIIGAVAGVMLCATTAIGKESISAEEARERYCMAEAILFEAGNQPLAGKVAVGEVIMNRVRSKRYPNTVCGVVHQGPISSWWKKKHNKIVPVRNRCQFSYYCDGKSDKLTRWEKTHTWTNVLKATIYVMTTDVEISKFNLTNGATHYHATYVDPHWNKYLQQTVRIEDHIFYK